MNMLHLLRRALSRLLVQKGGVYYINGPDTLPPPLTREEEAEVIFVDEPAEEPKEEPKAEEPKAEEPKAEEPKPEEPKAEEPLPAEPVSEKKPQNVRVSPSTPVL